jgi:hypothetical protein
VTWSRLAGPAFRPLLTDIYVGALAEVDHHATWVQAVGLWGRGAGVVAGSLAARRGGGRGRLGRLPSGLARDHLLAVAAAHPSARGSVQVRRVAELPSGDPFDGQ